MTTEKKYSFIIPTLKFCITGFFIPGFTAIVILGMQMGIELIGIECSNSWKILWTLTTIGAVAAPIIFVRLMNKKLLEGYNLSTDKLMFFTSLNIYLFNVPCLYFLLAESHYVMYRMDKMELNLFLLVGWHYHV